MPALTTRLSLPYPLLSDTADVPRDVEALANALDTAMLFSKGVLSSRPGSASGSPGIAGRMYYANDSGDVSGNLWFDYGTGWRQIALLDTTGAFDIGSGGYFQTSNNTFGLYYDPPANAGSAVSIQVQSEANPRFALWASGQMNWGPGTTAFDAILYRRQASELAVKNTLFTGEQASSSSVAFSTYVTGEAQRRLTITTAGTFQWSPGTSANDLTIWRQSAGMLSLGTSTQKAALRTYGGVAADDVYTALVTSDAQVRYRIHADGQTWWGSGAVAPDTNLYRVGVGILKTDTEFDAGGVIRGLSASAAFIAGNGAPSVAFQAYINNVNNTLLKSLLLSTDANATFVVSAGGKISWGVGGATATDTNLYRSGVNQLQTDGVFLSKSYFYSQTATITTSFLTAVSGDAFGRFNITTDGKHQWGSGAAASDTSLYRGGVGLLQTDGQLTVASTINGGANIVLTGAASSAFVARSASAVTTPILVTRAAADTFDRFVMLADGTHQWGGGTSAVDTNLYRPAAGYLKTDGQIQAGSQIAANLGLAAQIVLSSDGGIYFGSAADTNLYRRVAGALQTNALYITSPSIFLENGAFRTQRHPYGSDRHTENGYFGLGANVTSASVTFTNPYVGAPFLTWSLSYADIVDFPYASSGSLTSQPTTGFTLSLPAVNTARSLYWFAEGPDD